MTKLFIDGQEVALYNDLEIDYISCNPFFQKKGEFTYDLDIDLHHPQNGKIYNHINRADITKCPMNRKAVMISESRTIIKGTEIILSIDGSIAKIQIVGGNSELNYLSGNGLRVREMDFGTITVDRVLAKKTLEGCFPQYNFVCPPVYTGYDTDKYAFDNQMRIQTDSTDYIQDTRISPQPYLLYYVEKVVELLGYNLTENFLRDDSRWCRLYLVNGYNTYEYAKMLPDWTADEFITEIEKLFNCVFMVNQTDKTVSIVDVKSYYANVQKLYIDEILDEVNEKTFGVDENLYVNYDNVSFDFPSLKEYKYIRLHEDVLNKCEIEEVDKYEDTWGKPDEIYNKHIIYHAKDYGYDFIIVSSGGNTRHLKIVNRFADIKGDADRDSTLMKIVPAEIYVGSDEGQLATWGLFACAYARNANSLDETTEQGLNDMIQNGVPEEDVPDRIYVALYAGWISLFTGLVADLHYPGNKMPMSVTDTLGGGLGLIKFDDEGLTLTLLGEKGLYNSYYKGGIKVNTDTEYLFSFIYSGRCDPKAIYIIKNKPHYCKELKYKVKALGMDKVVEGTFYLME